MKNICQCDKFSFKGYLSISLLHPIKLQEILNEVKKTIQITKTDCNILTKSLYLHYDMKLVTFDINYKRNLIVQLHTTIHTGATYIVSN